MSSSLIRSFVRKAPLYQQFPRRVIRDSLWQRFAGLFYALKIQALMGGNIKARLERLKPLKGTRSGKRVLIIANGPSSNNISESQIQNLVDNDFEFIVMNDFYKNQYLSTKISPSFYCIGDPVYIRDYSEHSQLRDYFLSHSDCIEFRPADIDLDDLFSSSALFYNPIPGAGFTRNFSPLKWRCYPDGILFVALTLAKFLGYSSVLVLGAENSMYQHHYVSDEIKIRYRLTGVHSYHDDNDEIDCLPNITRAMSDVLFAHARFLEDLRKYCSGFAVNVADGDETNDALPRACLLPRRIVE